MQVDSAPLGEEAPPPSCPPPAVLEEWRGSSPNKLSITATVTAHSSSLSLRRFSSPWGEFRTKIAEAFVPEGFPSSVTPDYIPFQIWDSLQGLSTYIRSMLSTQALLSAIGVGEKSATVIGATFQWFLRDFTGMLGGILFTFYQGSNLDSNAKMWRLVADFMNDLGMLMDLVSPLFPSALILIVCMGSLSRSFTGVASGATRAALTQHFSLENNAADISAKEGSQETVATMIGMAVGMILAHMVGGKPLAIWISFLSLTAFHLYVISPQQVSVMERILPAWTTLGILRSPESLYRHICLGVKASSLRHADVMELLRSAALYYKKSKYLLLESKGMVLVVTHKESMPADILKSFIHALVLTSLAEKSKSPHTESNIWMNEHYKSFILKLQSSGWRTERLLTHPIVWRANWDSAILEEKVG